MARKKVIINKQVGERIEELRRQKGWSQRELAKRIGFQQPHIAVVETGKHYPSLDMLRLLVRILNTTYDYLLDGVGTPSLPVADQAKVDHAKMLTEQLMMTLKQI